MEEDFTADEARAMRLYDREERDFEEIGHELGLVDAKAADLISVDPVVPNVGPSPAPVPYDDVVELVIRNQTRRTVSKLFASSSSNELWGPNLLQRRLLPPGGAEVFTNEYCDAYYDLKAIDVSGNTIARANRLDFACGKRETITLF